MQPSSSGHKVRPDGMVVFAPATGGASGNGKPSRAEVRNATHGDLMAKYGAMAGMYEAAQGISPPPPPPGPHHASLSRTPDLRASPPPYETPVALTSAHFASQTPQPRNAAGAARGAASILPPLDSRRSLLSQAPSLTQSAGDSLSAIKLHHGSSSVSRHRRASHQAAAAAVAQQQHESPTTRGDPMSLLHTPDPILRHDPELVEVADGARPARSLPPRLRLPGHMLTQRASVALLEASFDERLRAVQESSAHEETSRHESVVAAHVVMSDVAHELTRQVAAQCEDRGRLLARVWLRYTDVVNALMVAWEDEQQRHAAAEAQSAKQLNEARRDYAAMSQHAESIMRESHAAAIAAAETHERTRSETEAELRSTRDSLRRLQAITQRALRTGDLEVLRPAVAPSSSLAQSQSQQTKLQRAVAQDTASMRKGSDVSDLTLVTQRAQAWERQALAVEKEKQAAEASLRRLEIQLVDAKAEVARLREFLRGTDAGAAALAPPKTFASVATDVDGLDEMPELTDDSFVRTRSSMPPGVRSTGPGAVSPTSVMSGPPRSPTPQPTDSALDLVVPPLPEATPDREPLPPPTSA